MFLKVTSFIQIRVKFSRITVTQSQVQCRLVFVAAREVGSLSELRIDFPGKCCVSSSGKEQRVQCFRTYGPLSGIAGVKWTLCWNFATKSLTVECQPPDSPFSNARKATALVSCLQMKASKLLLSDGLFLYSGLVCNEKMCAKNLYNFKIYFDLKGLIWNGAVN